MNILEKIARRFAFHQGARIVAPGQSQATREFGWRGDGEHFEKYTEAHWKEYEDAARMALEALREPSPEMLGAGYEEVMNSQQAGVTLESELVWKAMIDAALTGPG